MNAILAKSASIVVLTAFLSLNFVPTYAQEAWQPAPDVLFAPGIEVINVELVSPPIFDYSTSTPSPTPEARCGYNPYLVLGQTGNWYIDYATPPVRTNENAITPVTLCNRATQEQREIAISGIVRQVSASPDGNSLVLISSDGVYYGYNIGEAHLITLAEGRNVFYENRTISWHGNTAFFVYESNMGDMTYPWIQVSLGYVSQFGSVESLGTILKYGQVNWFRHYQSPDRTAWIERRRGACTMEWLIEETGERESFDIGDICAVGTPLTADPYGDYLFMPTQTRLLERSSESDPQRLETYSRDLIRLNLTTGERDDWYDGEMERFTDIDPSRRYVTMVIDNNGCIDLIYEDIRPTYDQCGSSFYGEGSLAAPSFEAVLLDTVTGQFLYQRSLPLDTSNSILREYERETGQVDDQRFGFGDRDGWATGNIFSLGADRFLLFHTDEIINNDGTTRFVPANDVLITLDEVGNVTETLLPGQVLLAGEEGQYFVLSERQGDVQDVSNRLANLTLYTDANGVLPLINSVRVSDQNYWEEFSLIVERGDTPDVMKVRLRNRETGESVVYTVRVP